MAVLSLFESSTRYDGRAAATRGSGADLGRLSRERRLAFYLGACRLLGLDPLGQPLRFVRCSDGRLRLFDPTRPAGALAPVERGATPLARLERELAAASSAVAAGGAIAYEIDLECGDLRVREMIQSRRSPAPTPLVAPVRRRGARGLASSRTAVRPSPSAG